MGSSCSCISEAAFQADGVDGADHRQSLADVHGNLLFLLEFLQLAKVVDEGHACDACDVMMERLRKCLLNQAAVGMAWVRGLLARV